MIEYCDTDLERIIARKELEDKKCEKEIKHYQRLLKLPFHLRIQEPSEKERLKEFEEIQKETFLNYSVKKWNIKKEDGIELFQEFFTEFLAGKVQDIREFLLKRGYKEKAVEK